MKKIHVLLVALLSVAGSQMMAKCGCAMEHGSTKAERKEHRAEERKRRKERKEARKKAKKEKRAHAAN